MIFFRKKEEKNINKVINEEERIKGSLYGFFIGDALGVPVEFLNRGVLSNKPIKQMEEYGTHNQPKGTWSDDSSMLLATIDSMFNNKELLLTDEIINYNDLMLKFSNWKNNAEYTPDNNVFDIGISTSTAISKFEKSNNPFSGDNNINSNGNGSLMRILPVSIFTHYCIHSTYAGAIKDDFYNLVKNVSSLTHSHDLSIMSCMIYTYFVDNYIELLDVKRTYDRTRNHFKNIFEGKINKDYGDKELYKKYFNRLIYNDISTLKINDIKSSGFVVDSLEATLWCILTTNSFKEATLKAVNLGDDTDTIGALTAALAGLIYGVESIPSEWINSLQKKDYLDEMVRKYLELISYRKNQNEIERKNAINEYMNERKEHRMKKATKDSWKTLPMTEKVKELEVNIELSSEDIELIKLGHVPFEMEDHWFMYFDNDDNTINYYRSWTGLPVFKGYLNIEKKKIYKLVISLEKEVYSQNENADDIVNQFKRMIENEIKCHK